MALNTYGGLKAALADWFDRGDMDGRIPDLVTLATATLNKVYRHIRMVETAPVALSAGVRFIAAPDDMLEAVFLTDATAPLEQVAAAELVALRQKRFLAEGRPRFFAVVGARLELCPTPVADAEAELAYYRRIPDLVDDGDSNFVLEHDADIYLYAALLHGAQFLHDARQAQVYESLLVRQITAAIAANRTIQIGPSAEPVGAA